MVAARCVCAPIFCSVREELNTSWPVARRFHFTLPNLSLLALPPGTFPSLSARPFQNNVVVQFRFGGHDRPAPTSSVDEFSSGVRGLFPSHGLRTRDVPRQPSQASRADRDAQVTDSPLTEPLPKCAQRCLPAPRSQSCAELKSQLLVRLPPPCQDPFRLGLFFPLGAPEPSRQKWAPAKQTADPLSQEGLSGRRVCGAASLRERISSLWRARTRPTRALGSLRWTRMRSAPSSADRETAHSQSRRERPAPEALAAPAVLRGSSSRLPPTPGGELSFGRRGCS